MSRIGKKLIEVPSGVNVAISGREVTISSGNSSLSMTHRPEVGVEFDESARSLSVVVDDSGAAQRQVRAYWGLTRALLQNMIEGVTKGYEKKLEVVGAGWGATMKGQSLELKVGFASPVEMPIPMGLDVSVERQFISIKGADKQAVGQFAAEIRSKRKPEPYNGKGVKYVDEVLRKKQGKVFGS